MRRQLRHLVDTADRPNITVRVVPLRVGPYAGLRGPFAILEFDDEPSLVYTENQVTSMFLDEKEDIAAYRVALGNILNEALEAAESVELIDEPGRRAQVTGGGMYALDLHDARWRKSSRSTDQANCVEVAFAGPAVAVRDSKNTEGSTLAFPADSWATFLRD